METKEKSITKICSFYANKWHLTTMILPHILKMLKNEYEIETDLEYNIEENMKELISKLNINQEDKNKILNIKWSKNEDNKVIHINNDKKVIIIQGDIKKIEQENKNIELSTKNEVTIINCYHVTQIEENISDILSTHDLILNTSGNHKINKCLNP